MFGPQLERDDRIELSVPGSIPQQRLYESPRCGCLTSCTSGSLRCPPCVSHRSLGATIHVDSCVCLFVCLLCDEAEVRLLICQNVSLILLSFAYDRKVTFKATVSSEWRWRGRRRSNQFIVFLNVPIVLTMNQALMRYGDQASFA